MCKRLISVGLDVGTTTTQLVVSGLTVENQASGFAVPNMQITQRQILYKSPVYFTPLSGQELVDGAAIRKIVEQEYIAAGIERGQVDTGAVIITGETSRKENAAAVLKELSGFAGDFVVATAGPDLESVLAAKGSGAVEWSAQTGKTVLHIDIGGGTSNMALIENGSITATGCLNVGGRLVRLDQGKVCYVSAVVAQLTQLQVGAYPKPGQMEELAKILTTALEMAAGLRPKTQLLDKLTTLGVQNTWKIPQEPPMLSFSGGVAACIQEDLEFQDLGGALGREIRSSRLCAGSFRIGTEPIRATVIGAGSHSAGLSGSTVYCKNVELPLKNLPVAVITDPTQISSAADRLDSNQVVLAPKLPKNPDYAFLRRFAKEIVENSGNMPIYIALDQDLAKALGHCLGLLITENRPCLCIDGVSLAEGSYLDVGKPVSSCFPVVIKTIVFEK